MFKNNKIYGKKTGQFQTILGTVNERTAYPIGGKPKIQLCERYEKISLSYILLKQIGFSNTWKIIRMCPV